MPSSHIQSHAYDAAAKRITVTFTNGHVYEYERVPQSVATGMSKSVSVGKYFHSMIKNRPHFYPAKKVEKTK